MNIGRTAFLIASFLVSLMVLPNHLLQPASAKQPVSKSATIKSIPANAKTYIVVVSKETYSQPDWRKVVDTLLTKHQGKVIDYSKDVRETLMELSAWLPDYVCFVARPQEANRQYDIKVHWLMRHIDDDPYGDAFWAILTGYDAGDALRIARYNKPLTLRRSISGTASAPLKPFESGLRFNEGKKGQYWVKEPGKDEVEKKCPQDCVKIMVDALNKTRPDCFFTSGHATPRDWQLGYNFKGGQFRCLDGQLYAVDTAGKRYLINSPNPKVYLAVGNCLIGMIPKRDCMALAWMHTGGAYQMFGHIASQWFGYMGWGMVELLLRQPGRFNVVESFYYNQQGLLYRLATDYPKLLNVKIEDYAQERHPWAMPVLAQRFNLKRDALGLLWERDTTILYGDPAWDARLKRRILPWSQSFSVKGDVITFTVITNQDGKWPKAYRGRYHPITDTLPMRVGEVKIIEGKELEPVITDNFIILPYKAGAEYKKGEKMQVVFRVKPLIRPKEEILTQLQQCKEATTLLPEEYRSGVLIALAKAGKNRTQLIDTIRSAPKEHRKAVAFLIANMPDWDLKTLDKDFLLTNVKYAYLAWKNAPWGKQIPESLFLNYILPYANVNERRDNWRKDFYDRFSKMAWKCKSPSEAAMLLNKEVFKTFNIKYHATKRRKPDQSPYETIQIGYASCTGLTILLVDACRAVGIPARLVGIPMWKGWKPSTKKAPNHNWTEVWDNRWYYLGSAEPGPLNKTWFSKKVKVEADPRVWINRVYAASFRKTGISFPLIWNFYLQQVPAIDITRFYTHPAEVTVNLPDKGKKTILAYLHGEVISVASGTDKIKLPLAAGYNYEIVIRSADGKLLRRGKIRVPRRPTSHPSD
ncbi:MAG: transglutaminase domain-containing protein [Planctomycetes bacterium]|nr:transglutaminase domain-containing protein [Planctomycetota bacterium]